MKSIDDYFKGESYPAGQFGHMLDVVPLEDAKRIAVDYAEQFRIKAEKWDAINDELSNLSGLDKEPDLGFTG